MTPAHYLRMGATVGFGVKDTLMLCPGVVFDAFDLYLREHGANGNEFD